MNATWIVAAFACCVGLLAADGYGVQDDQEKKTDEQVEVKGKIIIVGPDGKREVIELEEGDGIIELKDLQEKFGDFELKHFHIPQDLEFDLKMPVVAGMKYYLGVSCTNTSEALRSHLGLDEPCLLVTSVADDSPAGKAGMQVNDIIVAVDDQAVGSVSDLAKVVQEAGKEEVALSISFIRKGQEQSVDVTPVKREKMSIPHFAINNEKMKEMLKKGMLKNKLKDIQIPHLEVDVPKIDAEKIREQLKSIPDLKDLKLPEDKIKNLEEKIDQLQKLIEKMQNDKDDK